MYYILLKILCFNTAANSIVPSLIHKFYLYTNITFSLLPLWSNYVTSSALATIAFISKHLVSPPISYLIDFTNTIKVEIYVCPSEMWVLIAFGTAVRWCGNVKPDRKGLLMKMFQGVCVFLDRLGSHGGTGDALKQEYGLGIKMLQKDVFRISATVYLTTDYIANCLPWQIYKGKKLCTWFVELGLEIILQIFGNIIFRAVQKVSGALKGN